MFPSPTQDLLDAHDTAHIEGRRDKPRRRVPQLKEEIRALEGCYNSLSWPSRIPPEILCKIFLLVVSHSKRNGDDEEDLRWTRLVHVCRYWRKTALDYLALWSNLSFVSPEFTEVMLEWSRDAPLSIECGWKGQAKFQDVLCNALSKTKQLRNVILASCGETDRLDLPELLSVLSGPAPVLEDIQLFVMEDDVTVMLPTQFLDKTAPKLKSLQLYNIGVANWNDLPLRSTLTCLHLENHRPPNPAASSWTQLIAALQDMSGLEELTLERFLPTDQPTAQLSPPYSSTTIVPLGKLRSLKLGGFGSAIEYFIAFVRFPNATRVSISFRDAQDKPRVGRTLRQLAHSWGGRCQEPADHLYYMDSRTVSRSMLTFNFRSAELIRSSPTLHVTFDNSTQLPSGDLIMAFYERMDFSQLSTLRFPLETEMTKDIWIQVFGSLKKLREIKFEMGCSAAFLQALGDDTVLSASPEERPPCPTFPSLDSLDFMFFNSHSIPLLVAALRFRPPSSPKMQINFCSPCNLEKGMFRQIVDSLPHVKVKRHRDPDWEITLASHSEEEDESSDGQESEDAADEGMDGSDEE